MGYLYPYKAANGTTVYLPVEEPEIAAFLMECEREERRQENREKRNCPRRLESMRNAGIEPEYGLSPEEIYLRKERDEHIWETMQLLTKIQQRRLWLNSMGISTRVIAEMEGTSFSSVAESIRAAKKKFREYY